MDMIAVGRKQPADQLGIHPYIAVSNRRLRREENDRTRSRNTDTKQYLEQNTRYRKEEKFQWVVGAKINRTQVFKSMMCPMA